MWEEAIRVVVQGRGMTHQTVGEMDGRAGCEVMMPRWKKTWRECRDMAPRRSVFLEALRAPRGQVGVLVSAGCRVMVARAAWSEA